MITRQEFMKKYRRTGKTSETAEQVLNAMGDHPMEKIILVHGDSDSSYMHKALMKKSREMGIELTMLTRDTYYDPHMHESSHISLCSVDQYMGGKTKGHSEHVYFDHYAVEQMMSVAYFENEIRSRWQKQDFDPSLNSLITAILGLNSEAGEVADTVKKLIYLGDNTNLFKAIETGELDVIALATEVADVIFYAFAILQEIGCDPELALTLVVDKLGKRHGPSFNRGYYTKGRDITHVFRQD